MTTGVWTWWRDGNEMLVGWMLRNSFADDIPICTVHEARDATRLVDELTRLDARPIGG